MSIPTTAHWAPKVPDISCHQLGPGHGRRVDADLVSTQAEQPAGVLQGPHTTAHGQRDEDLLGGAGHHVEHGLALLRRRRDVVEDDLVGAFFVIAGGQLHRVAGIPEPFEADALDHPAPVHVQARDDPDALTGRTPRHSQLMASPGWRPRRRAR